STPETLFETHWIRMLRIGHWDYVVRPQSENCVGILAITPEDEIVLIEQFRIPLQKRVIEIPAGIVGDEPEHLGESLADTARRELLEETGYRAGSLHALPGFYPTGGISAHYAHAFWAKDCVWQQPTQHEDAEQIFVRLFSRGEIEALLDAGRLADAFTALPLLYWLRRRDREQG
ncbi:MAG TPA: NUDIX hydrolase, partial [Planctomycetota bacterium]|nr:NUDIX hydrolase [Planctomycetota bacterium]